MGLTKKQMYRMGDFDNGGRFTLLPEFQTATSELIRTPSRNWPLSVWKHAQTAKYYKSLNQSQLSLIS